jgi:type IV pilus assembly protein PilV
MKRNPAPGTNAHGFSIIDVLIGMAIFSIGILAVARMQMSTVRNTTNGNTITEAVMLAQQKMEEVKSVQDVTTLGNEVENNLEADGTAGAGIYNRTTTISVPADAAIAANARQVSVQVQWTTVHGGNRTVVLDSLARSFRRN